MSDGYHERMRAWERQAYPEPEKPERDWDTEIKDREIQRSLDEEAKMNETVEPELKESTGVSNPLVLVESMIRHGADPDALKKMMDLAERFQANQARAAYNSAMKEAQEEMGVVVKNRENTHTNSRYANLEAVNLVAKPVYTKHGFCLSFGESEAKREKCWHIYCDVKHVGGHQERYEGEFPLDDSGPQGKSNKTQIQAAVSSGSYAARILITRIFNLTIAETDDDGNGSKAVIDELQLDSIRRMFVASGRTDDDLPRFLAWVFNVAALDPEKHKLELIPAKDAPRITDWLKRAVAKKQAADRAREVEPA